jgi:hypothetical protein
VLPEGFDDAGLAAFERLLRRRNPQWGGSEEAIEAPSDSH